MLNNLNLGAAIKKSILGNTDDILIQFFRYSFAGGLAFVVDFSFLFIFTEFFRIHYLISGALSFVIALTFSYFLCLRWVFNKRRAKNLFWEFCFFSAIGVAGLIFNEIFLWFFTEKIGFYYLISKVIATIFVWFWNFLTRKFLLFN